MNVSFETRDPDPREVYSGYADFRPQHPAPATPSDLAGAKSAEFRKHFGPLLPAQKHARMLDVGCGYGEFLYFLQREGYTNTRGIDLDEQHVATARALGVLNLRRADGREFLRKSRQRFDFISAIDVLEHIPKAQVIDFLRLIRMALAPGGTFLCQVPNLAGFFTPLFYMDFTHETPFTAASLKQALQLAGFTNVTVRPMGPVVHGAKSAIRFCLWKGITVGLRFIQAVEGGPRDPSGSIYTAAIYAAAKKP